MKKLAADTVLVKKSWIKRAVCFCVFPALAKAALQIAHINIEPDTDGVYRKLPLLYEWEEGYIPSLGLAAAVLYLGIPVEDIELKAGKYLALPLSEKDVIKIPVDDKGRMFIPYTETWAGDKNRIPFSTVVKAKTDDNIFENVFAGLTGRIALAAKISTSQKDFSPTPFERLYSLSGVHSEVISAILDGFEKISFIRQVSTQFKIWLLTRTFLIF